MYKQKHTEVNMLDGPIFSTMVRFAIPVLFSSIFQQLYNTMDTVIVGHTLGETALAAIGAATPAYDLLMGFALGIGSGLSIVTARSYGSKDEETLKKSVSGALVIGVVLTLILTLMTRIGLMPFLKLLNTPEDILPEAYEYSSCIMLFMGVTFAYNLCSGILRAVGDSVMPLIFLIISSVLNIVLDLWFIVDAGTAILQTGINDLGYLVIAGHTAARKLCSFSMMPLSAMIASVNTFVSQNFGAGKHDRIRQAMKAAYLYNAIVTVLITVVVYAFAPAMLRLISGSSEPVIIENGSLYLKVAAPAFFVLGLINDTRTALQAIGSKVLPLFSSVIELIGKILFVSLLVPRFQYLAVVFCEPVIWCFMAVELVIAFWTNPVVRGDGKQ